MWACAIESCLKSLVHAFCVHDHHDEKELESIFAAVVPPGRKPPTITNQFAVRLEDRIESLHYSRPMLGAGCSLGVELFQVFMGTGLWHGGADEQVFHCLFIPTFACCLSILVESPFLYKGFASCSPYPGMI